MISKILQILSPQPWITKVFLTVGQNNFGNKIPFVLMYNDFGNCNFHFLSKIAFGNTSSIKILSCSNSSFVQQFLKTFLMSYHQWHEENFKIDCTNGRPRLSHYTRFDYTNTYTYSRVSNKHIIFLTFFQGLRPYSGLHSSVSSVVEFPGAGSSRLRTINSELNGAT